MIGWILLVAMLAQSAGAASEAMPHRQRGQALLDRGDLASALPEFERAVALDPRDAVSYDAIGIILGEAGNLAGAIAAFHKAAEIDPQLASPHFHLGLAYDRAGGRVHEAIGEYQLALRLQPDLIEALYGLSIACAEVGDLDGAIVLLRQVIAARPQLADAHYNLGLHLWERFKRTVGPKQSKDLDEAVAALTRAIQIDPNDARAHSALGQLLVDKQDLAPALDHLRHAMALAPDNPEHAYNLGLALRLTGEVDAAESSFRTALRLNPTHALARRSLGLILRQKGDLPAAATELRQSLAQLPDDAVGYHLLGSVLLKQGDLSGAIEELRQAVRLDPTLSEARVNLAQALARSGKREEALQEQAEIHRLNERNANIGRALILLETAATKLAHDQRVEAIADLREATTLAPDFAEAQYQLGVAAGDENALRQALSLSPNDPRAHAALARMLAARGDRVAALQELRRAAELAPGLLWEGRPR
jgi:tetratricopeptide (TPR) repeat protein